jgi:hypothetical protein
MSDMWTKYCPSKEERGFIRIEQADSMRGPHTLY